MIMWKFLCVVFIFDYATSLSEDSVFDEDDLKQLSDLISRWSRVIHKFPESQWMLNSFPHFKFKHFNNDDSFPGDGSFIDDGNKLPDPFDEDYHNFIGSTIGSHSTGEPYNDFSGTNAITTIKKADTVDGNDITTTEITNSNNDIGLHTTKSSDGWSTGDLVETTDNTDEGLFDENNTFIITEPVDSWNDNDTEALIIGILELLKNETSLIKEVEEFIKKKNTKCNRDLWYAVRSSKDRRHTMEMLDAAGKPAAGLLRGNIRWLGDYRQCQDVNFPIRKVNNVSLGGFDGSYCYTSWEVSLGSKTDAIPLSTGICVPDSCSAKNLKSDYDDIKNFFSKIPVFNKVKNPLRLTDVTCQNKERKWSGGDIVYMLVLVVFAIFIVSGTVCDLLKNCKQTIIAGKKRSRLSTNEGIPDVIVPNEATTIAIGKDRIYGDDVPLSIQSSPTADESKKLSGGFFDFMVCFSVYSNASKVLTVGNQQGQLNCLHGIRFLSLSWVIFGHVFVYAITSVGNIVDVLEDIDSFSFQIVSQATLAVDSFFLLSGLLLSYLYFKDCDKRGGKTNWIYYYVHRIWRLTPAFGMLLGFYTTLWLHMGSGPLWPAETDKGNCKESWWWNLLYIVNFHDVNKNCMGWTWYLANDMQFYIISPVFLILLLKRPIIGTVVVSIVTVGSWILTGVLSATNDFRLFMSLTENMQLSDVTKVETNQWKFFNIIYDKPYCRIGPYLIGLLLGYALFRMSGRQKFMKTWLLVVGWIVAACFGISVVFGTYHVEMGNITAAFYNALSRSVWSIALGWVIFVCLTGHAGPVNKLLSWNFWVPLSRLTYCAYLVHPMIMTWYYSSLQTMLHFQMNTMLLYYFGYLIFAYVAGFVASMAFESPMMVLEKFILKKFSK